MAILTAVCVLLSLLIRSGGLVLQLCLLCTSRNVANGYIVERRKTQADANAALYTIRS